MPRQRQRPSPGGAPAVPRRNTGIGAGGCASGAQPRHQRPKMRRQGSASTSSTALPLSSADRQSADTSTGGYTAIWSCSSLDSMYSRTAVQLYGTWYRTKYVGSLKTWAIVLFTRNVLLKRHSLKQRGTRQSKGLHHLMLFGPCIHPDMCLSLVRATSCERVNTWL
jgi:hypothetical protein